MDCKQSLFYVKHAERCLSRKEKTQVVQAWTIVGSLDTLYSQSHQSFVL